MKYIIFITILSLTFYSCIESTYVYNNTVKVDKEIEDVFTKYVQYWSEGNYDKITDEVYAAPMAVYLQDSTIVLNSKDDVKRYLISTFEELENNNYGFSKRNNWNYFRKEKNIAYIEMHYTRFLKDSSIMKPADRYSAYILTKKEDKFKISALIPFTSVAK